MPEMKNDDIKRSSATQIRDQDGATHLVIAFAQAAPEGSAPIDCVVDIDASEQLLGIELLDPSPRLKISETSWGVLQPGDVRISYDRKVDAFYLRLRDGRSARQVVLPALLTVAKGIVTLDVPMDSLPQQARKE